MNKIEISGRLVRDVTFITSKNNKPIAFITLAVWRGETSDGQDLGSEYIDVAIFAKWLVEELHENIATIKVGTMIEVTGKLQVNTADKMNKKLIIAAASVKAIENKKKNEYKKNIGKSIAHQIVNHDDVNWDVIQLD